jgi:tetratricopeptide (TPR) repeat protein
MTNYKDQLLKQAMNYFQQGNFSHTKELLTYILKLQPRNFDALHMMGVVLGIENKHQEAIVFLAQAHKILPKHYYINFNLAKALSESNDNVGAIKFHKLATRLSPNQADAWLNFGKNSYSLKRYEEALAHFDQALHIKPDYAEAMSNKGLCLSSLNRYEEALTHFDQALHLQSDYIEVWLNKGLCLSSLNRYEEALTHFDKVLYLKHDYAEAWSSKALCLSSLNRYEEALAHFNQALHLKPDCEEDWSSQGSVLHELKRYEEALACFDQALHLKPDYADALSNKGSALHGLKRYEEALARFDQALHLKPDYADALSNKGSTLHTLSRYEEALACIDQALHLKPDYAEAISNKGLCLSSLNRYEEALTYLDKSIELKPNYFEAYFNKAIIKLLLQEFNEGWYLYEYRWKKLPLDAYRYRQFNELQSLENIRNKNILVWHEQGMGDTIQFSRFIPELVNLGVNVTFEVQEPLMNLLKNQLDCSVVTQNNKLTIDFQVPLLTLPKLFKMNLDKVPRPTNIKLDPRLVAEWNGKINLSKKKPNIGFACSGNSSHMNDHNRSMPLSLIAPLLPFANYFLLQNEVRASDQRFLIDHPEINFLGEKLGDFEETAAIVENMDLVISVDTSLVHLAGSLGKKLLILLPWAPEWRWLLDRSDSPWYPSATILRQKIIGDWQGVIDEVKDTLNFS